MDTMQALGTSSAKRTVYMVTDENCKSYEKHIRRLLLQQPTSWEGFYSLETIIQNIYSGQVSAALLNIDKQYVALLIASFRKYDYGHIVCRIEFLTCNEFFKISAGYSIIEEVVRKTGCTGIEANAHPSLAKYFCRKHGFKAPGVYITKDFRPSRRN